MSIARSRRVTIRDVAQRAGVSHMTVSRVLNGANVSPDRAHAVQQAIKDTGFVVSASARQLATGRADAYAIVITEPLDELLVDPTYAAVIKGIFDGLLVTPAAPVMLTMATEQERYKGSRLLRRGTVDAVIHITPYVDDGILDQLRADHIPAVLCGQPDGRSAEGFSWVYTNDVQGSRLAAEHLLDRGADRIVAVLGPHDNPATVDRESGVRQVLGDRLVAVEYGDWDAGSGASTMRGLLDSFDSFDAVVCGNDRIAAGVVAALQGCGRAIPADVRVMGFDDHPIAARCSPPLSTIRQPFHTQGERAAALAVAMVNGAPPTTEVLDPQVVIRAST